MYKEVPIKDIKVGPNRRSLDRQLVEELKRSIKANGLLQPIVVTTDLRLVAGYHRLQAVTTLGRKVIECHIVSMTEIQADIAEIDENLERAELTTSERQIALVRRKELYEALYPETRKGGNKNVLKSSQPKVQSGLLDSQPPSFVTMIASKTGRPKASIKRDLRIGKAFSAEELALLDEKRVTVHARDWLATRDDRRELLKRIEKMGREALDSLMGKKETHGKRNQPNKKKEEPSEMLTPLESLEAIIGTDFEAFMRVSAALRSIRDQGLYIDGHGEFKRYIWSRWGADPRNVLTAYVGLDAHETISNGKKDNEEAICSH